jgi:hypothetical protein
VRRLWWTSSKSASFWMRCRYVFTGFPSNNNTAICLALNRPTSRCEQLLHVDPFNKLSKVRAVYLYDIQMVFV